MGSSRPLPSNTHLPVPSQVCHTRTPHPPPPGQQQLSVIDALSQRPHADGSANCAVLSVHASTPLAQLPVHLVSWFCNFAFGIPHHNIMDKREELRIPEDLTVTEGRHITEDTSSGCARCFFTFACCRERSGCAFQAGRLHQVRLSVSETLSLSLSLPLYRSFALSPSFHLVYYTYSQLDCIVSCHLASQHHS